MKRFLAVFLAATTLFGTSVFADGGMRYVCNNDEVEVEVTAAAIFKDGIVYLPVASVCKALGYKVIEKDTNNSVTAEVKTKPGYFSVFLGKSKGRMNGMDIGLAKVPFKENGVIYVTASLIEDQLGVSVKYDSSKNTIYIDNKGEGKITSTVGQAPVSKPAASGSSSSSRSGNKTYPENSYVLDFSSVTGVSGTKDSQRYGYYVYSNVSQSNVNKYISVMKNAGFQFGTPNLTPTSSGTISSVEFAYITKDGELAIRASGLMIYSSNEPTTVTIAINQQSRLGEMNEKLHGSDRGTMTNQEFKELQQKIQEDFERNNPERAAQMREAEEQGRRLSSVTGQ